MSTKKDNQGNSMKQLEKTSEHTII